MAQFLDGLVQRPVGGFVMRSSGETGLAVETDGGRQRVDGMQLQVRVLVAECADRAQGLLR
ncbi:hypothetical protein ACIP3A_05460 [Streptomyces tricolor]|uniref:hypothetical protein n=1 Tax=Streptomyces tricolor TaxID=68277 RepID=UPI003829E833